ncbi:MAG: DUF4278 domain-containing protein [Prochloraceae cyanobacterium]
MKLSYRGVSYENSQSILEVTEGEIGGKWRGQNWKYRYPRHIPQLQPKLYRQYRGVAYSICSQEEVTCVNVLKKPYKVVANEEKNLNWGNIRRQLERLFKTTKKSEDENLSNHR